MQGKCLCGNTEFSCDVSTTPLKIYQCHCSLCKKQSGSSANSATIIEATHFQWTKRHNIKIWKKPTGFSAHFCGECGCPVPNDFAGKYVWIPVGLLEMADRSVTVEVVANFCLSSKSDWHSIDSEAANFEGLPSFKEVLALLS
uniref:Glutathione-dependent formaldehyde-activating, GFA n=1 Tax=Psychrobacter sp. (strain PRwf-1) TaxID=349106 RepID=A5WH64_PSYWF